MLGECLTVKQSLCETVYREHRYLRSAAIAASEGAASGGALSLASSSIWASRGNLVQYINKTL